MKIAHLSNALDLASTQLLPAEPGQRLDDWLDANGLRALLERTPHVVVLNGQELPEANWGHVLRDSDIVALVQLPEGPAAAVATAWLVANWVAIAVTIAVSVAVTALMTPGMPDMDSGLDAPSGSPTYNINSRGNRARLGEPIPVLYGTTRLFPDLSSRPYTEYVGNEQYLHQLFEVTQGEADIAVASMRFEDTPLIDFGDYEVEVVPPGAPVTLYPTQVASSAEVSNQQIEDATLGPYTANAATTTVTRIGVDIVAPGGLFRQTDDGDVRARSVGVRVEALQVDDADIAIGSWFELGVVALSGDNPTAIRRSVSYPVTSGRYQVRVTRTTAASTSLRVSDALQWGALRGYLDDPTGITATTRVALKIRASNKVPNGVVNKFSLIAARRLPVWSAATGWSAPVATASPAWAFADAVRASYGGDRPDTVIDPPGLEALAAELATEGVEFNGVFDQNSTLWAAMTSIGQAARAVPIAQAGVYRLERDSQKTVPTQLFTQRNIVKDSFSLEHVGVLEETSDGVVCEYFDAAQDYRPQSVDCVLAGSSGINLKRVKLLGVTDRDQAFNLGLYLAASNRYRRQLVTWETGTEGRIPGYGDLITLSHYLLGAEGKAQINGDIIAFDGVDLVTLSEPVDSLVDPYLLLRTPEGRPTQVYQCVLVTATQLRVQGVFADAGLLDTADGYERIQFAAGDTSTFSADVKIIRAESVATDRIRLTGYIDRAEVYTAANGLQPPPPPTPGQMPSIAPTVSDLIGLVAGTLAAPVVVLSWAGAQADAYEVEYSTDAGASWLPTGRVMSERFEHRPEPGIVHYRVAGLNLYRGSWQSLVIDTDIGLTLPPPAVTALALDAPFDGPELAISWINASREALVECVVAGVVKLSSRSADPQYRLSAAVARDHGIGRTFDVRVTAINSLGMLSDTPVTLSVSNPAPLAPVNVQAIPRIDGITITCDASAGADLKDLRLWGNPSAGFVPGSANLLAVTAGVTGVIGYQTAAAGYYRIGYTDAWGDDPGGLFLSSELAVSPAQVSESKLAAELAGRLNGIEANAAGLVQEALDRATAVAGEASVRAAGQASIDGQVAALNTIITATQQGIDEATIAALLQLEEVAAENSQNRADFLSFQDAILTIDPETGGINLAALAAYQNANDARVAIVEQDMSATQATLQQKASVVETNALGSRLATAEIGLEGANSAIALKAAKTDLDASNQRITDAEVAIGGANAAIALRATNTDLTDTTARVRTAEEVINALDGRMVQRVSDIEFAGEAMLSGLLQQELTLSRMATAEQTLTATQDEQAAEATARLALETQFNTDIATTQALVIEESNARSTADQSLANDISLLSATVTNDLAVTNASIAAEATARADADTAEANRVDGLLATVNNDIGATIAAVLSESSARATADQAVADSVTALTTTVAGNTATAQEQTTSIDGILAEKVLKLDANGHVAGMALRADPTGSEIVFLGDKFSILHPDADSENGRLGFLQQMVNGVPTTVMDAAHIINLIVKSAQIEGLAAEKITAGEIAAAISMNALAFNGGSMNIGGGRWTVDGNGYAVGKGLTIKTPAGVTLLSSTGEMSSSIANSANSKTSLGLDYTDGADVTGDNTAAAIAGQGDFATLSQITEANASTYLNGAIIDTANIKLLAVGRGAIKYAAVDTLQLAGQAVIIPVSAYTEGPVFANTTPTAQTATIASTGAPVAITVSGFVQCSETAGGESPSALATATVRVKRLTGTPLTVYDRMIISVSGTTNASGRGQFSTTFQDTPGAGTHTYVFEVTGTNAITSNRSILMLETK